MPNRRYQALTQLFIITIVSFCSSAMFANECDNSFNRLTKKQKQELVVNEVISSIESGPLEIDLNNPKNKQRLIKVIKSVHIPSLTNGRYNDWLAHRISNHILFSQFKSLEILLGDKSVTSKIMLQEALLNRLILNGLSSITLKLDKNKKFDLRRHWDQFWTHPYVLPLIQIINLEIPGYKITNDRKQALADLLINGTSSQSSQVQDLIDSILNTPLTTSAKRAKLKNVFAIGLLALSISNFVVNGEKEIAEITEDIKVLETTLAQTNSPEAIENGKKIVATAKALEEQTTIMLENIDKYNLELETDYAVTLELIREKTGVPASQTEQEFIKKEICSTAQVKLEIGSQAFAFCN